jgi:hypothetical protein
MVRSVTVRPGIPAYRLRRKARNAASDSPEEPNDEDACQASAGECRPSQGLPLRLHELMITDDY